MSKVIKSVSLGFTNSHSDKVYIVEMLENRRDALTTYDVVCHYGKRTTPHSKVNLVLEAEGHVAQKAFDRQMALKVKKGYTVEKRVGFEERLELNTAKKPVDQPPIPMRQNIGKRIVGW